MGKILVVAEKPSAGMDMAKILGCTNKRQGYIEGEKYIVTWGIGHLVGLKTPQEHNSVLKSWDLETLPFRFPLKSSLKILPTTSGQFNTVKSLIQRNDVDLIINAGDAGREGYLIQEWIYRMAGNHKPVKVLWASSLTEEALKKAFQNLHERDGFCNILLAAEARAEADWLLGMNYSRGLSLTKGQGKILLRYGRCQTSLLNLVVKRELEIKDFQPKPYYEIWRTYQEGFSGILVDQEGKVRSFDTKEEADAFMSMDSGTQLKIKKYTKDLKKIAPPTLYNLADLQKEMGSKYKYDAEKTLSIAQALYEKYKVLSYPRTDSRVMSTDLAAEISKHIDSVLPLLQKGDGLFQKTEPFIQTIKESIVQVQNNKRYVNDTKVTDHHALVPTINSQMEELYNRMNEEEKNVFAAIVKRFLAIFLADYVYVSVVVQAETENGYLYISKGKAVLDMGWKGLNVSNKESEDTNEEGEENIPVGIQEGSKIYTLNCFRKDKKTQSPARYTVSSIIGLMEKYGIGTSATRADIINKLMSENSQYMFLKNGKYFATELGINYIQLIPEELKTERLTAEFEKRLTMIEEGELEKDIFLDDVYHQIYENLEKFKIDNSKIDEGLISQSSHSAKVNTMKCPKCGKPIYKGKYGWYCSGYKEGCKISVPLEIAHKTLTENQAQQLLEKGYTGEIKGFKKKDGGTFAAKLKMTEDGKVEFQFDKRRNVNRNVNRIIKNGLY